MRGFFDKVKGSALKSMQQGMQFIEKVGVAASEMAITAVSQQAKNPEEQIMSLFFTVCEIIDEIGIQDGADSPEAERYLYDSKVRSLLSEITDKLQEESEKWFFAYSENPDPELTDLPFLDAFLHNNIMNELCNRATQDLPRGCLPLILEIISNLLRRVRYPLLPQQIINKPISRLVSFAVRFDIMNTPSGVVSQELKQELASYKKRIGNFSFFIL